jgi:hypothetical protein
MIVEFISPEGQGHKIGINPDHVVSVESAYDVLGNNMKAMSIIHLSNGTQRGVIGEVVAIIQQLNMFEEYNARNLQKEPEVYREKV